MTTAPAASRPKAIYSPQHYIPFGEGASKNFGFIKHVSIGLTAGVLCGMIWKSWHWNEKRVIAQFYADLSRKEAAEEKSYQASISEKFKALEEELLAK